MEKRRPRGRQCLRCRGRPERTHKKYSRRVHSEQNGPSRRRGTPVPGTPLTGGTSQTTQKSLSISEFVFSLLEPTTTETTHFAGVGTWTSQDGTSPLFRSSLVKSLESKGSVKHSGLESGIKDRGRTSSSPRHHTQIDETSLSPVWYCVKRHRGHFNRFFLDMDDLHHRLTRVRGVEILGG